MSKITNVYDAILNKLTSLYPAKSRLANPYEYEDNADVILKDAYGLKVMSGTRSDIEMNSLSIGRSFSVVFIQQFASVGAKGTPFDTISKALLEDQQTFLNNINSPTELGQQSNIDFIEIDNISGIEFVATKEKKHLLCEIHFTITISEAVI
jgi:hypothetical protein